MNKNSKIAIGIVLILMGLVWTLSSFGITIVTFDSLIHAIGALWPLVFVVVGLNIIIDSRTANTVLWIILIGLVLMLAIYYTNYGYSMYFYQDIYKFFFR